MADAIAGAGVIFKYAAGTEIGSLTKVGNLKMTAETIDVTTHASTDKWKEFISGLKDGGEISLEGFFVEDDAGQLALAGDLGGSAESFVVVFPDTSQWAFSALITGVEMGESDLKGAIPFSATVKITGKPTYTGVTSLYDITFHVTAVAGGADIEGATVLFNGETKTTDSDGECVFYNIPASTLAYGVYKTSYTGQSSTHTVSADATVSVSLAAA